MRRFSVLFIVLGLIAFASSSRAQREIGAESLALDDGHGHLVDITIPTMNAGGPYSWVVPITPSGGSLALPTGTTTNSTLFWNGTQWAENPTILTGTGIYSGLITTPSASTTLVLAGANSGSTNGGSAWVTAGQAGSASSSGGSVLIWGGGGYGNGNGSGSPGGSVTVLGGPGNAGNASGGTATLQGGQASNAGTGASAIVQGGNGGNTGTGGSAMIYGGAGGNTSGPGGNISFWTTPNNNSNFAQAMQITNAGSVQIGSNNQFTVDNNGHVITSNSGVSAAPSTTPNFLSSVSVSGSDEAGVISFGAGSSEAIQSVTVTYGTPYATPPVVIVTPADSIAAIEFGTSTAYYELQPFVTSYASRFVLTFYDYWYGPAKVNYIVIH